MLHFLGPHHFHLGNFLIDFHLKILEQNKWDVANLETKLFASKRILNFAKETYKMKTAKIFSIIREKHQTLNNGEFGEFLENFEQVALSDVNYLEFIKPKILDFGNVVRGGKQFKKNAFVIDVQQILELYWADEILRNVLLESTIDGKAKIKLALYHDKISLVNPIGNPNLD